MLGNPSFVVLMVWALLFGTPIVRGAICPDKPSVVLFVLFDVSDSTQDQNLRRQYLEDFSSVIDHFSNPRWRAGESPPYDGEVFVQGDLITGRSLGNTRIPFQGCFPAYDISKSNMMDHGQQLETAVRTLKEKASQLLHESVRDTRSTDIIGALHNAQKVFSGENTASACHKYLILFSDMVEENEHYNLSRTELSDRQIEEILKFEVSARRLPNLKGVKVWVAGAGNSAGPGVRSDRILSVQRFWVTLFQHARADLSAERYASTLTNFAPPRKRGVLQKIGDWISNREEPCPAQEIEDAQDSREAPVVNREPAPDRPRPPILPPPPRQPIIESFVATPNLLREGEMSVFAWNVSAAEVIDIEPGIGAVDGNGEREVYPPVGKTVYRLTAVGVDGRRESREIEVIAQPAPPRILLFEAEPNSVRLGKRTVLRWAVEGAVRVHIEPDVGESASLTGQRETTPKFLGDIKYTLRAEGPGGHATAAVAITVQDPFQN